MNLAVWGVLTIILCLLLCCCWLIPFTDASELSCCNIGTSYYADAQSLTVKPALLDICRLANDHRHRLPRLAIGTTPEMEARDVCALVYVAQLLCNNQASVILVDPTPAALNAWSTLVERKVVRPGSRPGQGSLTHALRHDSISRYLVQAMWDWMPVPSTSQTRYYIASKSRDDEIVKAYEKDRQFTVTNVSSAFHAAVLRVLVPSVRIQIGSNSGWTEEERELFGPACQFLARLS